MSRLTEEAVQLRGEAASTRVALRIAPVPAGGAWVEGENYVWVRADEVEDAKFILHRQGADRLKELLAMDSRPLGPREHEAALQFHGDALRAGMSAGAIRQGAMKP